MIQWVGHLPVTVVMVSGHVEEFSVRARFPGTERPVRGRIRARAFEELALVKG